jgi:hypothetical protein
MPPSSGRPGFGRTAAANTAGCRKSMMNILSRSTMSSRGNTAVRPSRVCARESLGKEESDVGSIEETFRRNPVGQRAHPEESGQQPEASLASCGVTHRAKRRQRVSEPAHSAPILGLLVGAPAVRACGGRACSPVLAWEGGPAGVSRSRRGHVGVPQEPGRPVCSRRPFGCSGQPIPNVPGPCGRQGAARERTHRWRTAVGPLRTQ